MQPGMQSVCACKVEIRDDRMTACTAKSRKSPTHPHPRLENQLGRLCMCPLDPYGVGIYSARAYMGGRCLPIHILRWVKQQN